MKITNSPDQYVGISTDTKPFRSSKYSLFLELDTGDIYYNAEGPSKLFYDGVLTTKNGAIPGFNAAMCIGGLAYDNLTDAEDYLVTFEGETYTITSGEINASGDILVYVGSPEILMGSTGTYPFCFGIGIGDPTAVLATSAEGTYSIKVEQIPDSQWVEVGSGA